jgi:hypothetical protein
MLKPPDIGIFVYLNGLPDAPTRESSVVLLDSLGRL